MKVYQLTLPINIVKIIENAAKGRHVLLCSSLNRFPYEVKFLFVFYGLKFYQVRATYGLYAVEYQGQWKCCRTQDSTRLVSPRRLS